VITEHYGFTYAYRIRVLWIP